MVKEFKIEQCIDFPELQFRIGDLIKFRKDARYDVTVYKGAFGNTTGGLAKTFYGVEDNWVKNEKQELVPMLYLGCMYVKRDGKPGMILHFINGDSVWHAFFWNCMQINQNFEKVKP